MEFFIRYIFLGLLIASVLMLWIDTTKFKERYPEVHRKTEMPLNRITFGCAIVVLWPLLVAALMIDYIYLSQLRKP